MSRAGSVQQGLHWPVVQWRQEFLYVAYAVMEVCWITPLFLVLSRTGQRLAPAAAAAALTGLLLTFFYLARLAERWTWEPAKARGLVLAALLLAILLSWRGFLHPDVSLLDWTWIRAASADLITGQAGGHWLVMAAVVFLWWRGLALSRREFAFSSVALAFRAGVLLLAVGTVLLAVVTGRQANGLIYLFFFASLLAVALTRLEEVGVVVGEMGRRFDLFWLVLLVVTVALLLGLGGLFGLAASAAGIAALRDLWAPVGDALIWAVLTLISLLLRPFEPLLQRLIDLLSSFWLNFLDQDLVQALAQFEPLADQADGARGELMLQAAATATRLVCGVALLAILLLAGLWALNRRRSRRQEMAEERSALDTGLLDTLGELLQQGRQWLRRAGDLVGRFGLGSDLLAVVSVRAIYANTTRLARQRGYPRHRAATPHDYLPSLLAAFPQAGDEARAITDAYVGVHYGELPTTREELARLRAAYERLKNSPSPDA